MTGSPESFLFINVSRIGDTLFSTPAMRAVAQAYPGSSITALAHPLRAEVFHALPFLNDVGAISKRTAFMRGWWAHRRYRYAFVYGFDESLIAYALRVAEHVIAFRQKDASLNRQLYRCVEAPAFQSEHAVLQRLRLPAALGVAPAGHRLAYTVTPQEAAAARARLAADGVHDARPLIGLQVASFPTKAYRDWPIESFAELTKYIRAEWPRAHFLIYGGNKEQKRVQWLKDQLGESATLYAGRLSLRETAALMSLTDLYVGVDTGPTHIMSAFDIPLIGLYHCLSSSRLTGPLDHPCLYAIDHPRAGDKCSDTATMADISVATVFDNVQRALSSRLTTTTARQS